MAESGLPFKTWQLIDRKVVAGSAIQNYDFAPTIAISGNKDLAYMIFGFVVNDDASTANVGLRVNGAAIACNRQTLTASDTTIAGARDTTTTFGAVPTTKTISFMIWIPKAATGNIRHCIITTALNSGTSLEKHEYAFDITTPATSTDMTSLGIGTDQTSGLGLTTELNLMTLR